MSSGREHRRFTQKGVPVDLLDQEICYVNRQIRLLWRPEYIHALGLYMTVCHPGASGSIFFSVVSNSRFTGGGAVNILSAATTIL
jgi:hypothetical protein